MNKTAVLGNAIFERSLEGFRSLILRIEKKDVTIRTWVLTFCAIVFMRDFLEMLSTRQYDLLWSSPLEFGFFAYHSQTYYGLSFLGLAIIISSFAKEKIGNVLKFVLTLSILIFIAPGVDIVSGGITGKTMEMAYESVPRFSGILDYAKHWLSFVFTSPFWLFYWIDGSLWTPSINYGIRIEISLIMFVCIWYVYAKTGNAIRTVLAYLAINTGIMVIMAFPNLIGPLLFPSTKQQLFQRLDTEMPMMNVTYALGAVALWCVAYFLHDRRKFISLVRNFRFWRIMHVLLLAGFGALLWLNAVNVPWQISGFDLAVFITGAVSVAFEWFAAVCYNDVRDEKWDRVSMPDRPIVNWDVSREEMSDFALVFAWTSLYLGSLLGYWFFCMMLVKTCLQYLYSSPFFRLKSVLFVSNAVLALAYVSTVYAWYLLINPSWLANFPERVSIMIFIAFLLTTPFKDIKNVAGDGVDGIRTIPVVFGMELGKKIIGTLWILGFCSIPWIMEEYRTAAFSAISMTAWLAYFLLVTKRNYRESSVFILYFAYVAVAAGLFSL